MDLNKIYEAFKKLAETVKTVIKASMVENGIAEDSHIVEDLKSEPVGMDLVRVLIHIHRKRKPLHTVSSPT